MCDLKIFLNSSLTAYHACENAAAMLYENGFAELKENEDFNIKRGGKYFVRRDGSAVIAFSVGNENSFNVVASHADSPCFKLKGIKGTTQDNYRKFNVERYGGGIFYSWLDRPLKIAGRLIVGCGDEIKSQLFISESDFVIPSVAIHFNRNVNDGVKLNPQVDMSPVESIISNSGLSDEIKAKTGDNELIDADLFVVCAQEPFSAGINGELLCAPRVDDLSSAFASLVALIKAEPKAIDVVYIADNEEVGSRTKQGAGSEFLCGVLTRISEKLGFTADFSGKVTANSFMLSFDNAHAVHPNHPELSDPVNRVLMGNGIVIKRHANQNYTTDGFSSAVIKTLFKSAGVKFQDFYMRSDLPCGGTLGAISSEHLSIRSADIGIAQLAMHSAVETIAAADYCEAVKGLEKFFSVAFCADGCDLLKII
ncbi:MAG: M18 family aminopeptidase [Clostridia bacterium]|nr:M18 family aminopeptidase [Clostridia bacterium]